LKSLKEKYPGSGMTEYLEEVRHHILDNLGPFKEREGEEEPTPESPENSAAENRRGPNATPFRVYGVNVILAHNSEDNSPVIFETTPSFANPLWHHSACLTTHAAAGPAILWIFAAARCFAPTAASSSCTHRSAFRTGCLARTETHAQSQSPGNSAA